MNAMDLFSAGSETTATTLAWAVGGMLLTFLSFVPLHQIWTPQYHPLSGELHAALPRGAVQGAGGGGPGARGQGTQPCR